MREIYSSNGLEPENNKRKFLTEELVRIADVLDSHRFNPVPFHNRHVQTIAGITGFVPQFIDRKNHIVTKREFVEVAQDAKIALDYSLHKDPNNHPTVIVVPGITSTSRSPFSVGIANKAIHYGFNALRVNLRGANHTGLSSKTLSHAGLSEDIKKVLEEINNKGLTGRKYIAAFSFGGNMVLKAVGEMGQEAQGKIGGVGLVSSVVDTTNGWQMIHRYRLYEQLVLRSLKNAVKRQATGYSEDWDKSLLKGTKTIEKWESTYQVGEGPTRWGFTDLQDYYQKASALPHVSKIAVPTFIIHAEDDPIASTLPLNSKEFVGNPNIIALLTEHGGHGGFVNFGGIGEDLDGYWAQNRAIEFFRLLEEKS